MTGRNARLLQGVAEGDRIIEIGPLHSPVAPKAGGFATTVVDHASREDLLAKYAGHDGVDPDRIEAVDVIWRGGPLHEAFPTEASGGFAMLIASHVVEHLPDIVGFLDSAARLLDPERGVLALALPDKRWCFDVLKPVSTTGQALAAWRAGHRRHAPATLFDHNAYSAGLGDRPGWGREALDGLRLYVRLEDAKAAFDAWSAAPDAPYVDCHAWQFTPASFELMILELGEIGAADWHVEWIDPQPSVEFTTHLRRGRARFGSVDEREARRMALLRRVAIELKEQAEWLVDVAGPAPFGGKTDEVSLAAILARLDGIEARMRRLDEVGIPEATAGVAALREEMRPLRSMLDALMPVRRAIARVRRRV